MTKKKLKWSIAGIVSWIAAKASLFRTIGLVFIEDLFALKLGEINGGISLGNIILIISVGFLIWYFFEKDKK